MAEKSNKWTNEATASAFQNWVFEQTIPSYAQSRDFPILSIINRMELGRYVHEELAKDAHWLGKATGQSFAPSDWKLIYIDHGDQHSPNLRASNLTLNGTPLVCRPDVVLSNKNDGTILIIERKTTGRYEGSIPPSAWPNIRAQLWCYAWIDDRLDAPEVILICQFLRRRLSKFGDSTRKQDDKNPWKLEFDSKPVWLRNDESFFCEIASHFNDYGGEISSEILSKMNLDKI